MNSYIDLFCRHGAMNFTKIFFERFTPLGKLRYERAMKNGEVYFGEYLSARQGLQARHYFMDLAVAKYIEITGNKNPQILEIGSWAGGSAICFAKALKKYGEGGGRVTCVDIWEEFYDQDTKNAMPVFQKSHADAMKSGGVFELFKHNIKASGFGDIVNYFKTDFRNWNSEQKFDLIYIDGDHRYEGVWHDLNKASGLLVDNGFIMGDDLEKQYHEVDKNFCDENLQHDFVYDEKVSKTHIHPGVTKAVFDFFKKPVSEYEGFFVMQKKGTGFSEVEL